MAGRRSIPRNPVTVPAGWFIVLSVVACVSAAGWLGIMLVGPGQPAAAENASGSNSSRAPSTSPSTPSPAATTPAPVETASPSLEPEPEMARDTPVSVLNNTGITNLAQSFSAEVAAAGWTISGVGNWRGQIVSNTVYFPDGFEDQAQLLADDAGISRVLPSIVPMRMDRLTIILSGPQE